jgi:tRNA A37 threonylcarbamoyladenosine dehydratase
LTIQDPLLARLRALLRKEHGFTRDVAIRPVWLRLTPAAEKRES